MPSGTLTLPLSISLPFGLSFFFFGFVLFLGSESSFGGGDEGGLSSL